MLRKLGIIAVLSLIVVALAASVAVAANSHFVRGPAFRDLGTQLRVTGTIAGLGNENINVVVDAEGLATVECRNPGGNVAPGQTTEVDVTGSANDVQVKNGKATFTVITNTPTVGSEACPNRQWTATVTDVEFTGATITVIQAGQVVLEEFFEL